MRIFAILMAIAILSGCRARAQSGVLENIDGSRVKCTRADGQNLKEDYWDVTLSGSNIKFDGYSEGHSGPYARSDFSSSSNKQPAYTLHLFFTSFYWDGTSLLKRDFKQDKNVMSWEQTEYVCHSPLKGK